MSVEGLTYRFKDTDPKTRSQAGQKPSKRSLAMKENWRKRREKEAKGHEMSIDSVNKMLQMVGSPYVVSVGSPIHESLEALLEAVPDYIQSEVERQVRQIAGTPSATANSRIPIIGFEAKEEQ